MLVIHITTECYPAVKNGGLADVIGALPKYIKKNNVDSRVVIPYVHNEFTQAEKLEKKFEGHIRLGDNSLTFSILKNESLGFELYFVHIPGILDKEKIYGYDNDSYRFLTFQIAVLEWFNNWEQKIDLLHCHDHNTGLIPFFVKSSYQYEKLLEIPVVFTVHNTQYQGTFHWDILKIFPCFDPIYTNQLLWNNYINSMAVAIRCSDRVTTVSPQYMEQLNVESHGLEYVFQSNRHKCKGILNGIDDYIWNPETDSMISANYTTQKVDKGKAINKRKLCAELNFEEKKPIILFLGKLSYDKGADVLEKVIRKTIKLGHSFNFIIKGGGNEDIVSKLKLVEKDYSDRVKLILNPSEEYEHQLFAGADFYLKPSREEPCGLKQMYSLKYGTVPIVSSVGGLNDTVVSFEEEQGYGVKFSYFSIDDILFSLAKAEKIYQDKGLLNILRKRMMILDFSWNNQAKKYVKLYKSVEKNKKTVWKLT